MDIVPLLYTSLSFLRIVRIYFELKKKKKRFRRWWVKPHIRVNVRNAYGSFATFFAYFKLEDHEEFNKMFRLTVDQFLELYELLKSNLKKSIPRREPINS